MDFGFPTRTILEGQVQLVVPEIDEASGEHLDYLISHVPVFYNPRMKLNRDISVLCVSAFQKLTSRELSVCEPMAGTGVRGLRIAMEVGHISKVVMSDLNSKASGLAAHNASTNRLDARVETRSLEANLLLALHGSPGARFDYVDIDPFGSPAHFLDNAARALKNGGILAATATDMAPLCGAHPLPCFRRYGGHPLHSEYCHETALRLLIGAMVTAAARNDKSSRIVFSHSTDHYVRAYAVLDKTSKGAAETLEKMGLIAHCFKCLEREMVSGREQIPRTCDRCGSTLAVSGPMWLGELSDPDFCEVMLEQAAKLGVHDAKALQLLHLVESEHGYPATFFNVSKVAGVLGIPPCSLTDLTDRLVRSGFRATGTHFDSDSIKTDAPLSVVKEIIRELNNSSRGTLR